MSLDDRTAHGRAGDTDPQRRASEGERRVVSLRSHGRAMFWPSLALIVIAGAVGYFAGRFDEQWQNLAVIGGGVLLAILLWLMPLIAWLSRRYTITTRRIVLRHGVLVRTRQELLHSRGYDITVRKNAVQSLFGSGHVLVNTGRDRPIRLVDVPNADLVQGALHDLMESSMNPIAARREAERATTGVTTAYGAR